MLLLNFALVLFFSLYAWAIDNTLVPEAKGEDVVCEVIKKIEKSSIFGGDEKMLRRIAYVESKFGTDQDTYRPGYNGGIWQIDRIGFDDAMITGSHPKLDQLWKEIEKLLAKEKKDIKWENLRIPLFSGVFARIRLYLVAEALPASNELGAQAKYWKYYYNGAGENGGKGTEEEFVKRVNAMNKKFGTDCNMCKGRMNLAIVMDGSGSIGANDYKYAKQAADNLIDTFSNDLADVGYVLFSTSVEVIFPLKSNLTRDQMKQKIDDSYYPDGGTKTNLGIEEGCTILQMAVNDTGIPKIMVIFTDGQPDDAHLATSAAEHAKQSNITIFAIGIGSNIVEDNLNTLASQDSFVIPSYERLTHVYDKINSVICSVPQTPGIGNKVENDKLGKNEKRYFKYEVPGTGVTIIIDKIKGNFKGYYSYTIETPSSAINDGEFNMEVFITPLKSNNQRAKRDVESAGVVHVAIQGQDDDNVYSLETSEGNHTSGGDQVKISMFCIITNFILFVNFFSS
ncbi:uncharacterized protein LOC116341994 [Contarinia nasturtii]|uniref:uncharacterized protein LOC116341994 n=1 Tax=Contarinia nasturtii TaxID=265458 RepID=UPI0012D3FE09|nr:uncharacterized protein LOC116341994 [Contarinia nasturtii]